MKQLRIYAPATVANLSCGYDSMGLALDSPGDEMIFRTNETGNVEITRIEGASLPYDIDKNVAGAVAVAMLKARDSRLGVEIEIYKNFKPGSGLGSSSASAAGTAFAIDHLLGGVFSKKELLEFAMLGEKVACGSAIADNVSPALFGGIVLIRSYKERDIINLPVPEGLTLSVIHPQIEIKTEEARQLIPDEIPLKTAVTQWSNVGGFVSGLYENDFDLISRSLEDLVAEPNRKALIPHFEAVKSASLSAGALGFGISGSGPSMFALSRDEDIAHKVAKAMEDVYKATSIDYSVFVSKINKEGVRIISE